VPALRIAEGWRGTDRADFLAYQADMWKTCIEDSLVPPGESARVLAVQRATQLATAGLAIDSTNVQALQTLAWLKGASGDNAAELDLRHRIVQLRPGDPGELMPYLVCLVKAKQAGVPNLSARLAEAEQVRARAVGLMRRAEAHWPDPAIARIRGALSTPLVQ